MSHDQRPHEATITEPYPDDLPRCCEDTLRFSAPRHPTEGIELPCDYCNDYLRFEGGRWVLVPFTFTFERIDS